MTKQIIKITLVAVCLLAILSFKQMDNETKLSDNETIELIWKLGKKDTIVYETTMAEIGESTFSFSDFFGGKEEDEDTEDFFDELREIQANTNLITRLTNSTAFKDVIDIEMITSPKEKNNNDSEIGKMMNSMVHGTMLRGAIHKSGNLYSFWVQNGQKNLLSLFFELPTKPLQKGDSWALENVNFIGNNQNFICKEASRKNKVTLVDIKSIGKETLAIIEYDIEEFAAGELDGSTFFNDSSTGKKAKTKVVYKARGEFSVEKGKWVAYNGIMSTNVEGVFNSEVKQKFALVEK